MKVGVNIAIFDRDRVLLTRRKDFGVWCLPGGHIEQGESAAQAAVRESAEETGLNIRLERLIGIYSIPEARAWVNLIILFAAQAVGGTLMAQEDEVLDIAYFAEKELPANMLWGHRQRIRDAFERQESAAVWLQHVPFDPVENRELLYEMQEESGLSGEDFYAEQFGWDDPENDRMEVGTNAKRVDR